MPRAPFAAVCLSLAVLLAPDLTLAPVHSALDAVLPVSASADASLGPSVRPRVAPLAATLSPRDRRTVDPAAYSAALREALELSGAYGATFAVARDGVVVWAGSAGTGPDGRPLPADESMVVGSVTKTFVAAAVLELVAEGRLGLDEPIGGLLPAFGRVDGKVTVRQLLNHGSGVADIFNEATRVGLETEPARAWSAAEVLATIDAPWHPAGDGWSYSNTNYLLLGLLVEAVTGRTLADELGSRFFDPLGLESPKLLTAADPAPLSAAWATIFWGSGAMSASAADIALWGDRLYGGSGLLGDDVRRQMLAFNEDDYGLGAQRIDLGQVTAVGHTGLLSTYTTLMAHLPGSGVTIALMVNQSKAPLDEMLQAGAKGGGRSLLELVLATGGD